MQQSDSSLTRFINQVIFDLCGMDCIPISVKVFNKLFLICEIIDVLNIFPGELG